MNTNTIQMTLFENYMEDTSFTIKQATKLIKEKKNMSVTNDSIRARIYEGVDTGVFKRLSRGVYQVISQLNDDIKCLLINGDGRDLSMLKNDSIDGIVTDHPYDIEKALTGGNRKFAIYELFRYTLNDFKEKYRVLKQGAFCCEFLPEESELNYEYLYEIKKMAEEAGFKYYAKVSWKKGSFVSNTGRKSKNREDILFLTKGSPRCLKINAKKNIETAKKNKLNINGLSSYEVKDLLLKGNFDVFYMKGTNGMLPTEFDVQPKKSSEKIISAEKPVKLLEKIIEFISKPNEWLLDQFSGSGNFAIACYNLKRNSIVIEKNENIFTKLKENVSSQLKRKIELI